MIDRELSRYCFLCRGGELNDVGMVDGFADGGDIMRQ